MGPSHSHPERQTAGGEIAETGLARLQLWVHNPPGDMLFKGKIQMFDYSAACNHQDEKKTLSTPDHSGACAL